MSTKIRKPTKAQRLAAVKRILRRSKEEDAEEFTNPVTLQNGLLAVVCPATIVILRDPSLWEGETTENTSIDDIISTFRPTDDTKHLTLTELREHASAAKMAKSGLGAYFNIKSRHWVDPQIMLDAAIAIGWTSGEIHFNTGSWAAPYQFGTELGWAIVMPVRPPEKAQGERK